MPSGSTADVCRRAAAPTAAPTAAVGDHQHASFLPYVHASACSSSSFWHAATVADATTAADATAAADADATTAADATASDDGRTASDAASATHATANAVTAAAISGDGSDLPSHLQAW